MIRSFLALGDSYTIGEGVAIYDSYPYQCVQLLRRQGLDLFAPEIIAKTGWTTGELAAGLDSTLLLEQYDIVTLLIGVNNQYRGLSPEEYSAEFETLLLRALDLAPADECVFVLSIPDWSLSPFAADPGQNAGQTRDLDAIAQSIDDFNIAALDICNRLGVAFIDITGFSRQAGITFADDGLHPSGDQYAAWAQELAAAIIDSIPPEEY